MTMVEQLIENARSRTKSGRPDAADYEQFKHELARMNISDVEYEAAIKRLCEAMEL